MNTIFKQTLKKVITPSIAYTRSLLTNQAGPEEKFLLFFRPRSGSNLLRDLINCHPQVYCDEEIFRQGLVNKVQFPYRYIQGRAAAHADKKVFGFKLNINQINLQSCEPAPFLLKLQQTGWKVIYTQRGNLLQQAISFFVAQKREVWLDTAKNALADFKLSIDVPALLAKMERMELAVSKEKTLLADFPRLEIIYEQDLLPPECHQSTADRVFQFLEINSVPVKANLVKTSSKKLSEYVENYDDMVASIANSKYATLLNQLGK